MTVSVLVPFRDDGAERSRAWQYVRTHYETHHDYELVVGSTDGEWSKGAALADALSRATGDILVLADADSFIDAQSLRNAIDQLGDAPWVIPHWYVYRLRPDATADVYAGSPPDPRRLKRRQYQGVAGGGLVVLRRETYEWVGVDPRFQGWGGEDRCFGWALHALVGPAVRLEAPLWHLWHPHPSPRHELSPEAKALQLRYRLARKDPQKMRAIVEEAAHESRNADAPDGHDRTRR